MKVLATSTQFSGNFYYDPLLISEFSTNASIYDTEFLAFEKILTDKSSYLEFCNK